MGHALSLLRSGVFFLSQVFPVQRLSAALIAAALYCSSSANAAEYRAFWVDGWGAGFRSPSQVETLLGRVGDPNAKGTIRDANCNMVIVQVRRRYDVAYPSGMGEPYMSGLSPANFNALQAMIAAAHDTTGGKKRVEVHCWLVTFATAGGAVYSQHIGTPTGSLTNFDNYWPTRDNVGNETDDKAFDPGHPLVLQYLVNVCMDLVNNFDIDGIHYDYIRFTANNQGYNPTSLARYNARYGLTGQPVASSEQFKQWRRDQVSALVRQVYARIQKSKPLVKQSGSFVTWNPSPTASTRAGFQATRPYYDVYSDWDSWMQEGIMDIAVPMTYYNWASLPNDYTRWMNFEKDRHGRRHMIIGPGTYLNSLTDAIKELVMTRDPSPAGKYAPGFSGYSYRVPYAGGTWTGFSPSLISQVTSNWADLPEMPWKVAPTNGHIMGTVTLGGNGAWADHAIVNLTGPANRSQFVDGTGFFAFVDLPPGSYTLTATKAGYTNTQAAVAVALGTVTGNMYERNLVLNPATAPTIGVPPQGQTAIAGQPANFAVTAAGAAPLVYQWQFNQTNLAGATSSSFTRMNCQPLDAGDYRVVITNALGAVTSAPAALAVNFSLTTGVIGGGSVPRNPDLSSYPPGTMVTLIASPHPGYAFFGWSGDAAGSNNPLVVNLTSNQSVTATFLTVGTDIIIDNPDAQAAFSNAWQTGTSSTDKYGPDYRFASTVAGGMSNAVYRPAIGAAGYYDVFIWYPQGGNRATNAPWSVVYAGGSTNVSVNQTVNGGDWRLLAAARPFQQGTNGYVRLSNDTGYSGKVVLADAVKFSFVGPINSAPTISAHPQSLTLTAGTNATFSVSTSGTPPPAYQWQFNSADIPGATHSSFTLTNVTVTNAGQYAVIVTNSAGSATSSNATLIVYEPPDITVIPQSRSVKAGTNVTFTVTASGTAPLGYQWQFNTSDIAGATNSWFTIPIVDWGHEGEYSVVVTNLVGVAHSPPANLLVLPPSPSQIDSILVLPDGNVQFTGSGDAGNYAIEVSTNLLDWEELLLTPNANGSFFWLDSGTNAPQRFYRARHSP